MSWEQGERKNVHLNGTGLALEPVGHVDFALLLRVAVGEDVDALDSLVKVAKDVEDDDNGLGGIRGTGDV